MRAIIISQHGGPEVLQIEERPDPVPTGDQVLIEVKAFGLNHAECYFRSGAWGNAAEITGIECAGIVREDPGGKFRAGDTVAAAVGGLGRTLNGSYAELVAVPRSNVAAVTADLNWAGLAALPESYGTAWTALMGIQFIKAGQVVMVRGATSALGQAAVNIARYAGAYVIGTTRSAERDGLLRSLGANEVLIDAGTLAEQVRETHPDGIDAVLDIVGNTTVVDSLSVLKRGGSVCEAGFLGGGGPLTLEPVFQIPSGRHLTSFASALVMGTPEFPFSEIPFQEIAGRAAAGDYKAHPSRVLAFEDIQEGHRLMEEGTAGGKIVVVLDD
ncbi:zinc-binding dehydrogenase [Novosphingobium beihaiensis]|uniref:Zinc-binding dehydrogenase n=1 Tax=Novosphingobium beihaiensis TaxID=2930389 RepID=A0ABT0BK69_9SPHN|nr:zinc-binding dehydrogenase [Novosphingobium beihaiensis]MCJ2185440.1 zinc-binding dehydrogenase [Novosphingobium beihaiensis]